MKIYSPNIQKADLFNKLHVNSGVTFINNAKHPISYFPKTDWKFLPENFNISTTPQCAGKKFISIIKVNPYIRQLFWEKIEPLLFEVTPDVRTKIIKNYSMSVIDKINKPGFVRLKRLHAYELVFNPPNKISTAYNHKERHQVGLHIDTHNIQCLWQRRRGFELLSINLGEADRYFYYINLEVNELLKKLKSIGRPISRYKDVKTIKDDFLQNFPTYPVNRITVKPDEAYIGISQNFIHDGGTNNVGKPDVTLLIGGFFEWAN